MCFFLLDNVKAMKRFVGRKLVSSDVDAATSASASAAQKSMAASGN